VQVQLEGRGRKPGSAGDVGSVEGCGIFRPAKGFSGLSRSFTYVRIHGKRRTWFQLGPGLGFVGDRCFSGCENRQRGEVLGGRHA
jgi:hypothetical protein